MTDARVDLYLRDGCGRCEHYQTPACKVHRWKGALEALRVLVLEAGLTEDLKWGCPCYTLEGKNVAMLGAFKDTCRLSFFRGASLEDPEGELIAAGPNSHHARYLAFHAEEEVRERRARVLGFLAQAMELEGSRARGGEPRPPRPAPPPEPLPPELEQRLDADPSLRLAFEALTPGRRRSYVLHVAGAKQSETRARRAERCVEGILAGKGFQER